MYFRQIALAAILAGSVALPALAQTTPPDTDAPKADTSSPMPDAGVKKAPAPTVKHKHHTTHLAHKAKTDAPAKAK
jgi:hypothetical protein